MSERKTGRKEWNWARDKRKEPIAMSEQQKPACDMRKCEFCGCLTNARQRYCCDKGRDADRQKPEERCCVNTDRELWREREGDYFADSIHVTESGGIGINCGGTVYVKTLREWSRLAEFFATYQRLQQVLFEFKQALENSHR